MPAGLTGGLCAGGAAGLTGDLCAGGESRLPVGLQIIGRKFRDEDVLAAARALEEIQPWDYEIPLGR